MNQQATSQDSQVMLKATALLHSGHRHLELESYGLAVKDFESGIDLIGDQYKSEDLVDDTGMKLLFARSLLSKRETGKAAGILERVLESRIGAYEELRKRKQ